MGSVDLLRPGGEIYIYVYSSNLITPVNRVTPGRQNVYEEIV